MQGRNLLYYVYTHDKVYTDLCTPSKLMVTLKQKIVSYVEPELKEKADRAAEQAELSTSAWVSDLVARELSEEPKPHPSSSNSSVPMSLEIQQGFEVIAKENGTTASTLLGIIAAQIVNGKRSLWPEGAALIEVKQLPQTSTAVEPKAHRPQTPAEVKLETSPPHALIEDDDEYDEDDDEYDGVLFTPPAALMSKSMKPKPKP
ncbi:hypothetical protein H6F64_00180 [Phormidium sp. FACHB-77]|nr:hypothetical protein [Phormidium sp. FACHB-77]